MSLNQENSAIGRAFETDPNNLLGTREVVPFWLGVCGHPCKTIHCGCLVKLCLLYKLMRILFDLFGVSNVVSRVKQSFKPIK